MGKTHSVSKERVTPKAGTKTLPIKSPKLTKAQQARLDAFRAFVKRGEEQWAAMTPKEQREELEGWERVKATINADRAGYRQVFVDD